MMVKYSLEDINKIVQLLNDLELRTGSTIVQAQRVAAIFEILNAGQSFEEKDSESQSSTPPKTEYKTKEK